MYGAYRIYWSIVRNICPNLDLSNNSLTVCKKEKVNAPPQSIGVAELVVGSADANARGKGLRTDEYDVMTDAPRFGSDAFRSDVTTHADALVRDFDDDTRAQVLKQFEFYFCDSNLPRDNFLLEEVHESTKAGRGGAVYISLIAGFS